MCVQNLVPIGPQATTCIPSEGYTHRQTDRQTETHTLSYIDINFRNDINKYTRETKPDILYYFVMFHAFYVQSKI